MSVELELYGPYRDIVGTKEASLNITSEASLATVIELLSDRWPELQKRLAAEGDGLPADVILLKNGRPVSKREFSTTTVSPGDTLSLAPAISGG